MITIQATELTNRVQIDEDELLLDNLELTELVTKVLGFLEMEKPVGACDPSLRTLLQMAYSQLAVYLRQPAELAVVDDRASGVIWAVSNMMGKVEFRVLDLDGETNEITGSRIYAAEPATAAVWLKSMLCAASGSLPFDDLIQIREALSERIKSSISGDTMAEQASAFFTNSFAALAAKFKAPALQCQLAALSDSDHDRLEAFCTRHPQLGLEPHKVLKTAIEFDQLRTAAMNLVVKLSNDVLNSLNVQSFAVQARSYSGLPASLPTQRTVSSLTHRSTKVVADALYLIETQVKAKLMAATMVNIQMGRVDTEYSARQMVELVLAIAENQIDTRSVFTLDEIAVKNLNFAVDEWWRMTIVETLDANGLLALVTSGKDAGRARAYDGTQKHWYPVRKRTLER